MVLRWLVIHFTINAAKNCHIQLKYFLSLKKRCFITASMDLKKLLLLIARIVVSLIRSRFIWLRKSQQWKIINSVETSYSLAKIFELLNVGSEGHQPSFLFGPNLRSNQTHGSKLPTADFGGGNVASKDVLQVKFRDFYIGIRCTEQEKKSFHSSCGWFWKKNIYAKSHLVNARTLMVTSAVRPKLHDQLSNRLQRTLASIVCTVNI